MCILSKKTNNLLNNNIMKIRKLFLMGAIMLFAAGNAVAQDIQEKTPFTLNGIWQMCFYRSDTPNIPGELKTSNSLKILTDDGKFANLVMSPTGAIIIGSGKYEQISSHEYVETVEKNLHLPQLVGVDNMIQFEVKDNDVIVLKYFLKEDSEGNQINSWCYETWKRVRMPDAYPIDIIR